MIHQSLSIFRQTAQSVSRGHVISANPIDSWMHGRFHYDSFNKSFGYNSGAVTGELELINGWINILHKNDSLSSQVQRLSSVEIACRELWREEHLGIFVKGLSARLVQSAAFSFSIIVGYETIKRISIQEEYKHLIKW